MRVKNASDGIDTQKETSKGHIPRIFFIFYFCFSSSYLPADHCLHPARSVSVRQPQQRTHPLAAAARPSASRRRAPASRRRACPQASPYRQRPTIDRI
jgi:hypothetical protein